MSLPATSVSALSDADLIRLIRAARLPQPGDDSIALKDRSTLLRLGHLALKSETRRAVAHAGTIDARRS